MKHLIVSREYPPSNYPQGGIGTYAAHIARLLVERGETVHVIAERWKGAPLAREAGAGGRLIVHRVSVEERERGDRAAPDGLAFAAMLGSEFPAQAFSWRASLLAEALVKSEGIECIEGQDFEAPLYYFLVRRALGMGPGRQPPCFVHLHSPAQFIFHHNDWAVGRPRHLTMKRLEDYVIQASDAALCPSRYLARQAERHYGLAAQSITHIPLPKGDTPLLDRGDETWRAGTICYVGRMEARKGVFEWIDAAVTIARERPGTRFEMIGSDTPLTGLGDTTWVRPALLSRVPEDVRSSITFHQAMPRLQLLARLARARIAAVPSRWENFPNTCVEAMATGLPVLASREGGMIEMVEDGRTGWIADRVQPDALAAALRRALDTPAAERAAMGAAAARAIRELCDNTRTIDEQLAFRARLVKAGPVRSLRVPARGSSVDWEGETGAAPDSTADPVRPPSAGLVPPGAAGVAVVVAAAHAGALEACVASLLAQRRLPSAILLDAATISRSAWQRVETRCRDAGVPVRSAVALDPSTLTEIGVAFVDAGCRLLPEFIEAVEAALVRDQGMAAVSHWHVSDGRAIVRPSAQRPYQWVWNDVSPCAVFRTKALGRVAWIFEMPSARVGSSEVALALLLDGWGAMTLPVVLSRREGPADATHQALEAATRTRLLPLLRERYPAAARDMPQLIGLITQEPAATTLLAALSQVLRMPASSQWRLAAQALRHPLAATKWVVGSAGRALRGAAGRRT